MISLEGNEVVIPLEDFTVRIPVAQINTPARLQRWSREPIGWLTAELSDQLWHFCAITFEWH